ncbi:hypothetical protein P8C59_007537 [Phyllachora maydis]|uniref:Uncharacterized protein n=1 Tax=Phyllachora maydis TaxID=1825666 RepID=A0AAD9I994_9PEZI|nr:hypothetical protein P8C59_007537 [Phyllachora maydis]
MMSSPACTCGIMFATDAAVVGHVYTRAIAGDWTHRWNWAPGGPVPCITPRPRPAPTMAEEKGFIKCDCGRLFGTREAMEAHRQTAKTLHDEIRTGRDRMQRRNEGLFVKCSCGRSFARQGDRDRHQSTPGHQKRVRQYHGGERVPEHVFKEMKAATDNSLPIPTEFLNFESLRPKPHNMRKSAAAAFTPKGLVEYGSSPEGSPGPPADRTRGPQEGEVPALRTIQGVERFWTEHIMHV